MVRSTKVPATIFDAACVFPNAGLDDPRGKVPSACPRNSMYVKPWEFYAKPAPILYYSLPGSNTSGASAVPAASGTIATLLVKKERCQRKKE